MQNSLLCLFLSLALAISAFAQTKPRVFIKGQGTINVTTQTAGNRHGWFGATTMDSHNESIELAKDIREVCPEVSVTLKEEAADFLVMLNRESKAKKGLLSKNSQVLIANKEGDVIWTKNVRKVASAAKDVCAAIINVALQAKESGPPSAAPRSTTVVDESGSAPVDIGHSQSPAIAAAQGIDEHQPSVAARVETQPSVMEPAAPPEPTDKGKGNVERNESGYLGASSNENPRVRRNGVLLSGVVIDGPAYDAGLQAGDVILSVDGHYVYTVDGLSSEVGKHRAGERITIKYMRGVTTFDSYAILSGHRKF